MTQVAISSGHSGVEAMGDFLKELKCEVDFVNDKMKEIDTLIHEVENEPFLKLSSLSADQTAVKEFNNLMFEIKKLVRECDRQLRISHDEVQDFSRKVNEIYGPAVDKRSGSRNYAAAVSTVATGPKEAVVNQLFNEEERKFREIKITIETLQEQLKEAVDKLKGYISNFQSKNIPIANW